MYINIYIYNLICMNTFNNNKIDEEETNISDSLLYKIFDTENIEKKIQI